MNKQLLKNSLVWGFVIWLIGWILGIVLFAVVPPSMIGWVITPIGIMITLWVLFKKNKKQIISVLLYHRLPLDADRHRI